MNVVTVMTNVLILTPSAAVLNVADAGKTTTTTTTDVVRIKRLSTRWVDSVATGRQGWTTSGDYVNASVERCGECGDGLCVRRAVCIVSNRHNVKLYIPDCNVIHTLL